MYTFFLERGYQGTFISLNCYIFSTHCIITIRPILTNFIVPGLSQFSTQNWWGIWPSTIHKQWSKNIVATNFSVVFLVTLNIFKLTDAHSEIVSRQSSANMARGGSIYILSLFEDITKDVYVTRHELLGWSNRTCLWSLSNITRWLWHKFDN